MFTVETTSSRQRVVRHIFSLGVDAFRRYAEDRLHVFVGEGRAIEVGAGSCSQQGTCKKIPLENGTAGTTTFIASATLAK